MKTIEEGNKLIAEFMGRCGKVNKHLYWVNIPSVKWVTVEQMQFHTSWDWIMPVVEKIEKTWRGEDIFIVSITSKSCSITLEKLLFPSIEIAFGSVSINEHKIKAVWLAVVEFIEWYNNK